MHLGLSAEVVINRREGESSGRGIKQTESFEGMVDFDFLSRNQILMSISILIKNSNSTTNFTHLLIK